MIMRIRKIAEGAYFVPSFSAQTVMPLEPTGMNQALVTDQGVSVMGIHPLEVEPYYMEESEDSTNEPSPGELANPLDSDVL